MSTITACDYVTAILNMLQNEIRRSSKNNNSLNKTLFDGESILGFATLPYPIIPEIFENSKNVYNTFSQKIGRKALNVGLATTISFMGLYGPKSQETAFLNMGVKEAQATLSSATKQIKTNPRLTKKSNDMLETGQAEVSLLVGSAYQKRNGDVGSYGHTALHVKTEKGEKVYDFGRYGKVFSETVDSRLGPINLKGEDSPRGEGILREWDSLSKYLEEEKSLGRGTKLERQTSEYSYKISEEQASKIIEYFEDLKKEGVELKDSNPSYSTFKLKNEYHAIYNNCTTISVDGFKKAVPFFGRNSSKFVDVTSGIPNALPRLAYNLLIKNKNNSIFLPKNLDAYLNKSPDVKVDLFELHRASK